MTRSLYPLLSVGFLALLALAFVGACGASPGAGSDQGSGGDARRKDGGTASGSGNPTLGDPNAPVLMVEWGDFQ